MYVRISGRLLVNAASLNAQGTVGNLVELTKVHVVRASSNGYELVEVPVVTGNSLKHWHFVHFIKEYKKMRDGAAKLCSDCIRGVGFRTRQNLGNDEAKYIEMCAGEDLHGFLMPEAQVRRESLVKFSFLIPVEDLMERAIDTVTHNRVVVNEEGRIEGEAAMMLFKRQYSSSMYGFSSTLDLGLVGTRLYSANKEPVIDQMERAVRAKAALMAFIPFLSGLFGANTARSLPVEKVEQLLVTSSNAPLPLLVNAAYSDYVRRSLLTLRNYCETTGTRACVHVYGIKSGIKDVLKDCEVIEVKDNYDDWSGIFRTLAEEVTKTFASG